MSQNTATSIVLAFYEAERVFTKNPTPDTEEQWLAHISPDIIIHQTPALPYGGEYRGITQFRDWSRQFTELYSSIDVRDPDIFEKGDTVIIHSTVHATIRKTGEQASQPLCQVMKVDLEKGLVTEARQFVWDVAAILAALEK